MSHLTSEQRYTIESMLKLNCLQKEIAKVIGKSESVISRELKRNSYARSGVYKSLLAHKKADMRKKAKPKYVRFTLEMQLLVSSLIEEYYSPEQIVDKM